jgi:hypothetical protein
MDKAEFVKLAPLYYAMAIANALRKTGDAQPDYKIRSEYTNQVEFEPEPGTLLDRYILWNKAVEWLLSNNLVSVRHDPFGPPIFTRSQNFDTIFGEICGDGTLPFFNFAASGLSNSWLIPALHSVENHYTNLKITEEDFDNPDRDWEPIQIDPDESEARRAVEELKRVIDDVRSDNGYSATYPHERDYVLQGLSSTVEKFESCTISAGYVRLALDRLSILGRRFAGSAKEALFTGAKVALVEFAKKHFGQILNYLWQHLF